MKKIFKKGLSVLMSATILMSSGVMATSVSAATNSDSENYTLGDVDGNGRINVDDINKLQDYLYGDYKPSSNFLASFLKAADINEDGQVDDKDVDTFVDAFIYADSHLGDVDGNGSIGITDASNVQKYLADTKKLDINSILAADFYQDGRISVNDATAIQKQVIGMGKPSSFPTAAVKADDKKYRKKYADYIEKYNLTDMLDGYYLLGRNTSSDLLFRDEKWGYYYSTRRNVIGLFDYFGNNSTEVLPSQLSNGTFITEVGVYSNFSPLYEGFYADIKSSNDPKSAPYSKLQNIFVPAHYKLYRNSFEANKKIKSVFFASENGVSQEWSVFRNCTSLERVILPSSMNVIPHSMFEGCTSLKKVIIPENVTTIERSAFADTSISKIVFPKSVNTIEEYACATTTLREAQFLNPTATIHLNWASAYGMDWSSLTVYGYKNSTLYDWWKQAEKENLNVKIVYLN